MSGKNKIFVIDTNVILHDSSCIYQFMEHDVVIPITVLEELDQFKKGNQTLNFHAREFLRAIDAFKGDKLFNGGVRIAKKQGRVMVRLEREIHDALRLNFSSLTPDHRILNIAFHLAQESKNKSVILVTKDVNLRLKARSLRIQAEDYTTDYVKDITSLYSGYRYEENIRAELIGMLFDMQEGVPAATLISQADALTPNEFFILKNGRKSALARYDFPSKNIVRIEKSNAFNITPRNAEQTFAVHALLNDDIPLVTITGKAGTGKTLLALACALEKKRSYRQILLARPIIPLSNKDIGYLPGDIDSKLKPYMQPLWDNLGVIRSNFGENSEMNNNIQRMLDEKKLVIEPLAYIRGRSLVKLFMIVDEAQNLTPHEVKTIITRAGEKTKIVFTGDIFQIDHPYLDCYSNGLSYLIERMKGQKVYAHINLLKGERSEVAELASDLL